MFDSPFDFIAIVIAIVAFIIARKAMNEVAALRAQLASLGYVSSVLRNDRSHLPDPKDCIGVLSRIPGMAPRTNCSPGR